MTASSGCPARSPDVGLRTWREPSHLLTSVENQLTGKGLANARRIIKRRAAPDHSESRGWPGIRERTGRISVRWWDVRSHHRTSSDGDWRLTRRTSIEADEAAPRRDLDRLGPAGDAKLFE